MKKLTSLLTFVAALSLLTTPSFGALGVAGAQAKDNNGSSSGTVATSAATHTAGNLLWVAMSANTDLPSLGITVSCANTAGDTFTPIGSPFREPGNLMTTYQWYAKNINGHASDVVTCTMSSGSTTLNMTVMEISGADATAPLGTSAIGTAENATSAISGTFTTPTPNQIIVTGMMVSHFGRTFTPGTGYTIPSGATTANGWGSAQYKIVSSTQSGVTADFGVNTSTPVLAIPVATFKQAGDVAASSAARRRILP